MGAAVGIHRHEVQAVGRHLNGDLLKRAAIPSAQQRRLAPFLREEVRRSDGKLLLRVGLNHGLGSLFYAPGFEAGCGVHRLSLSLRE